MSAESPTPPAGRRVAFGEGWILIAGMAAAAAALFGMWTAGSGGSWRALLGMAAVFFLIRFGIAPLAAAFTRALRRRPPPR